MHKIRFQTIKGHAKKATTGAQHTFRKVNDKNDREINHKFIQENGLNK